MAILRLTALFALLFALCLPIIGCPSSGGGVGLGDGGGGGPITITTSSLANGETGVAYSVTVQTSGGAAPITFAVTVGTLPSGLSLNASTGEISGTPDTVESQTFTVTVTDSSNPAGSDTQSLTITVTAPPPVSITTSNVPGGTQNRSYSTTLQATDGQTPYSWAVTIGSLPAGLSLSSSGVISGTPTTVESQTFTVTVTDSTTPVATSDSAQFTINVVAEPVTVWESRGIGGGGALFSVTLSPHDTSDLYCATDMTGVFHSTDFGANWATLDFRQLRGGHRSHVRYTSDPNILYAVHTSEPRVPRKSTDGGATFTDLASNPAAGDDIFHLFADPASTDRVLMSGWRTLYFSSNGGTSFTTVYTGDAGTGLHIGGVYWDGANIYVGTNDGLLVSTNNGASFSNEGRPTSGQAIISLCGARDGGTVRLFCITAASGDVWGGVTPWDLMTGTNTVWRQTRGQAWEVAETGINGDMLFIGCSLSNVDTVWAAGGTSSVPSVYRTTNAGSNWSAVLTTSGNGNVSTGWMGQNGDLQWWWAEHALGFGVSPVDPDRALIVDWGFAHITSDGGATWKQCYVDPADENPAGSNTPQGGAYTGSGIQQTAGWWMNFPSANSDIIVAGMTDIRGSRSTDGGSSWVAGSAIGLPHNTTYHVIEAPDGTLYAATSAVHDMYQSTYLQDSRIDSGDGHILMSSNNGASWSLVHDFNHPVIWMAIDPNDPTVMVASVIHSTQGGIFRTTNLDAGAASSWSKLADPPRTEGHPFNVHILNDGTLVCTYSGRRTAGGAFTTSSGVFVSTNNGASWIDRSVANMQRWTKDLIIDPHDANQNRWYACVFSHWGAAPNEVGGVYRTTDRGQNWTRISDLYRVNSLTIDPSDPDHAWVTTEAQGLWECSNLTAASPDFTQDPDFPFMHPVRVFYHPAKAGEIWVITFGNAYYVRR